MTRQYLLEIVHDLWKAFVFFHLSLCLIIVCILGQLWGSSSRCYPSLWQTHNCSVQHKERDPLNVLCQSNLPRNNGDLLIHSLKCYLGTTYWKTLFCSPTDHRNCMTWELALSVFKQKVNKFPTSFHNFPFGPLPIYTWCFLVDWITSKRGRHILIYTWCFNMSLLSAFDPWFLQVEGL